MRNHVVCLVCLWILASCCQRDKDGPQTARKTQPSLTKDTVGRQEVERHAVMKLTWKGYDGLEDPGEAVFVLDGNEMGQGEDGLNATATALAQSPQGSMLVVYPCYFLTKESRYSAPNRLMPLDPKRFAKLAEQRGLSLVLSADGDTTDKAGNLVLRDGEWVPLDE